MLILLACAASCLSAAAELSSVEELFEGPEYLKAFVNPEDHVNRPNVLLIGDSISNAYTVDVRKQLHGKADVFRIPGNGKNSAYGLANLDSWIGDRDWDIIHFNWGLWDLCYRHPESKVQGRRDKENGTVTASLEEYRANMEEIVARLKQTDAMLIWCTTTPVPEFEAGRKLGDDLIYNGIAAEIMKSNGVSINDLHSHALLRYSEIQKGKGDVHYTAEGSAYLAEKVASEISLALSRVGKQGMLRVLNFQADNGFQHRSQSEALGMVERIGVENDWDVVSSRESSSLTELDLSSFDVVVFNNNCGNKGPVMTPKEQAVFQRYIQSGGGFLGIHCAGAIWKEGSSFQPWYEGLIGTKLVDHPKVQEARLIVEDRTHLATRHLPAEWIVTDEWHRFGSNPREKVHVLISVDEDSYEGEKKMKGDHPFVWYHEYDGGRSFFTSLGHTKEIYGNPDFEKLIEGAVLWAAKESELDSVAGDELPVGYGLSLDLDANHGVELEDGKRVKAWHNQVSGSAADVFVKRDEGRKVPGSGRPTLKGNVAAIGGGRTIVFEEQELLNWEEDAFDHLTTGSGYTWFSVMCVYEQNVGKKDVNSFFGNLKNGTFYEGFWGNLMDDNRVWMGSRNGIRGPGKPTLWDDTENPLVVASEPLIEKRYYLVMGRMGAGQKVVDLELFINSAMPVDSKPVPVNPVANPSKMAIGQERDATNHPGKESFHGEIARLLIYERPLENSELLEMIQYLMEVYQIEERG